MYSDALVQSRGGGRNTASRDKQSSWPQHQTPSDDDDDDGANYYSKRSNYGSDVLHRGLAEGNERGSRHQKSGTDSRRKGKKEEDERNVRSSKKGISRSKRREEEDDEESSSHRQQRHEERERRHRQKQEKGRSKQVINQDSEDDEEEEEAFSLPKQSRRRYEHSSRQHRNQPPDSEEGESDDHHSGWGEERHSGRKQGPLSSPKDDRPSRLRRGEWDNDDGNTRGWNHESDDQDWKSNKKGWGDCNGYKDNRGTNDGGRYNSNRSLNGDDRYNNKNRGSFSNNNRGLNNDNSRGGRNTWNNHDDENENGGWNSNRGRYNDRERNDNDRNRNDSGGYDNKRRYNNDDDSRSYGRNNKRSNEGRNGDDNRSWNGRQNNGWNDNDRWDNQTGGGGQDSYRGRPDTFRGRQGWDTDGPPNRRGREDQQFPRRGNSSSRGGRGDNQWSDNQWGDGGQGRRDGNRRDNRDYSNDGRDSNGSPRRSRVPERLGDSLVSLIEELSAMTVDDAESLAKPMKKLYIPHPSLSQMHPNDVAATRKEKHIRFHYPKQVDSDMNPVTCFKLAGFSVELTNLLEKKFQTPTAIQQQAWPIALSGHDLIGIAETGSGKTLAFILPGIVHASVQPAVVPGDGPIVLVLAPTRELALQIAQEAEEFAGVAGMRVAAIYGQMQNTSNNYEHNLARGSHIVVACPGKLMDFYRRRKINFRRVTYFVLDEADRLLDMGFKPQIDAINCLVRPDRQMARVRFSIFWRACHRP